MTIKSYILKKYAKHISVTKSETTDSLYIRFFNEYIVRISDHSPSMTRQTCDMYITKLRNNTKMYMVSFYPNMMPSLMSYKEIVSYIDSLCLMYQINNCDFTRALIRKREESLVEKTKDLDKSMEGFDEQRKQVGRLIESGENKIRTYTTMCAELDLLLNGIRDSESPEAFIIAHKDDKLRSHGYIYDIFFDKCVCKDFPEILLLPKTWAKGMLRCVFETPISYTQAIRALKRKYQIMRYRWCKDSFNAIPAQIIKEYKAGVRY